MKTKLQYDIREAPSAIRDSYKMYYKLKTSFLEETLSDALDEDSFDLSILENSNSQTDLRLSSSFSELSTPDVSALTSESSIILQTSSIDALPSTNDTVPNSFPRDKHSQSDRTEFEPEEVHVLNEKAWLRTTKSVSNTSLKSNNSGSSRKSMSDKLFRGASFQQRNPRKSLSRSSLTSNHSSQSLLSSSQKESFPDLQTYLSQKSKQQEESNDEKSESQPAPMPLELKPASTNLINNIDEEWLNRCDRANNMENDLIATSSGSGENRNKTTTTTTTEHPKVFGLSNINVSALATFERSQNTQEVAPKSMLSFDMNNLNLTAQNSFGGLTAQGSLGFSGLVLDEAVGDDEEVANSEDEADLNSSRQIRSIRNSTKRKHNEIDREVPTKLVKIPTNVDNNPNTSKSTKEENSVKVEKTKSQAIRKTKSITKPRPNAKPESSVVDNGATETVVVTRKSSRNATKPASYKQIDSKSDNDEDSDPFAGDDSDKDPNFSDSQETKSRNRMSNIVSSPNTSDDETPQQQKEETVKTTNARKRVARTKSAPKQARVKVERKAKLPAKKKPTMADGNSSASETEPPQETPDDYMLEFGMEKIKSVPRVPIAELKQNTLEFSKYVYSTDSSGKSGEATNAAAAAGASKPKPLSTKNAIARDKLESKIAAGALNDNYVRLNLRKKVFVRGKKTMNFSRYKKKLWKSKKAAALSGPEMDMRGCDGGVLTCFQCGLPGHFAQNCTVKSEYFLGHLEMR